MESSSRKKCKYRYAEREAARGVLNHNAKLTHADLPLITGLLREGLSRKVIAEKFEVSKPTIQRIADGTHWLCRRR